VEFFDGQMSFKMLLAGVQKGRECKEGRRDDHKCVHKDQLFDCRNNVTVSSRRWGAEGVEGRPCFEPSDLAVGHRMR
jgi:hypothetical protein